MISCKIGRNCSQIWGWLPYPYDFLSKQSGSWVQNYSALYWRWACWWWESFCKHAGCIDWDPHMVAWRDYEHKNDTRLQIFETVPMRLRLLIKQISLVVSLKIELTKSSLSNYRKITKRIWKKKAQNHTISMQEVKLEVKLKCMLHLSTTLYHHVLEQI